MALTPLWRIPATITPVALSNARPPSQTTGYGMPALLVDRRASTNASSNAGLAITA